MPKNNVKKDISWAVAGTFSQVSTQLVTLVILARFLTPSEFGLAASATLIIQFVYIFTDFGILTLVVQKKNINTLFISTAYNLSCILGLFVTATIYILSPLISKWFESPELEHLLKIYCIYLIAGSLCAVHSALAQRALKFRHLAQCDIISFLLGYGFFSIILAFFGFSYWSPVLGYIAQISIKYILVDKELKSKELNNISKQYIQELFHFGVGQSLSRLGSYLAAQIDSFIVASKLGMASIGLYSRAHQLASMPANQLGGIFDKLIFPYIARQQANTLSSKYIYLANLKAVLLIGTVGSALIFVMGELIVDFILGSNWGEVTRPLQILSFAIPLRLIQHVSDPTARAFGSTYRRAWRQWLYAILTGILSIALYPYGISAVAWGVVGTSIVNSVLMVALCQKLLHFSLKELIASIFSTIVFSVILFFSLSLIYIYLSSDKYHTTLIALLSIATIVFIYISTFQLRNIRENIL